MKVKEFIDLWKRGFLLALKIYALAYMVQFIFMIPVLVIFAITSATLPYYVSLAIILIPAVLLAPPLIAIAAEHLRITREPTNKFGIDFSK